jgi:hypothetical protein
MEQEQESSAIAPSNFDSLAQAMREGKRGIDYFPSEACEVCGAIPYLRRKRYALDHDMSKHGIEQSAAIGPRPGASEGASASLAAAVERAASGAREAAALRARRVSQDDD